MTRYKQSGLPVKDHRITIRLTETEFELLDSFARKSDMTYAAYIRKLISGKTPTIKYEIVFNSKEILKIFANLSNVAGNLNQIAHHLNSGGDYRQHPGTKKNEKGSKRDNRRIPWQQLNT